jgi:hypothetical protein
MKNPLKDKTPSDTKQQPKLNKPSDSEHQPKVNKPSDTKQHPKVTDLLIQKSNKPCQRVPGLACSRWPACRRVPSSATCSALSTKRT